jgi:uncharacterized membrane protein
LIFRNPQALALLLLLPIFMILWRWRGRRVVPAALLLRLLTTALLVTALADPVLGRPAPAPGPLVILADQSDSLTEPGKAALRARAAQLADQAGPQARVLFFGGNVFAPPNGLATAQDAPLTPASQSQATDPSATDIAAALSEARALLGAGGGRVVLLSDGAQTAGDALAEAQHAANAGIVVDVQPFAPPETSELRLEALSAPRTLRVGEEYPVQLKIFATGAPDGGTARLQLWANETVVADQEVPLAPGDNPFTFRLRANAPGVVRLRAVVDGVPDTFPRNNVAAAVSIVAPPPRVLLVEGRAAAARELRLALSRAGVESEVIGSAQLPTRLPDLQPFDGMVLLDVSAVDLSLEQMTTVREFVRSEGRGLVAIGGRSSFTLGAYKGTPLEQVLPVHAEAPPRPQRPDVALLLVLDHSASMGAVSGISKLDMAKEAAILATETLDSEDRVALLEFDTDQNWVVEFQQVGSGLGLSQIHERIGAIGLGGGTNIYDALNVGLASLASQPSSVRHAVLLTDGRSFTNDLDAYNTLISLARQHNITVSSIAIGADSDTELLGNIARWGGGRYYFAQNPEDIPRLTLLESAIARSDPAVEGLFRAELVVPHPLLRDFTPSEMPQLGGYVATTVKPEAEVVLRSPEDDPVLAAWQYGLGRAVAWLPSSEEPWAANWPGWQEYGRFWAQLVRYTLAEPDSGPLQVRVEHQGAQATVTVDARGPGGAPVDLADTEVTFTLPDGNQRSLQLPQVAPGRYAQALTLPSDGPYALEVRQTKDNAARQTLAGFVQSAPAEYGPTANGRPLIERIAQITGGQMLDGPDAAPAADDQPVRPSPAPQPLWPWLLLAALLLWVCEIAVRRGRLFVRR